MCEGLVEGGCWCGMCQQLGRSGGWPAALVAKEPPRARAVL
jgi:hypothetical protein